MDFLRHLACARARSEPLEIRAVARRSWFRRWCTALSCCAAQAFAMSLLERRGGLGADGEVPTTSDVVSRDECALTVLLCLSKKKVPTTQPLRLKNTSKSVCREHAPRLFGRHRASCSAPLLDPAINRPTFKNIHSPEANADSSPAFACGRFFNKRSYLPKR